MSTSVICDIQEYHFDANVSDQFYDNHYASSLWPVVYLLINKKEKAFYTGETTNMHVRIKAHLKNEIKSRFETLYIITCNHFTVSLTREIEFTLIKYISCDTKYKYINRNKGILSKNYFQKKELFSIILQKIWAGLLKKEIVKNSLKFISNSDFFKYSPYTSLTPDQSKALASILNNLLNDKIKTTIVEGGAGTGKSVLAVFLFALLKTDLSGINLKEFGDYERKLIKTLNQLKAKIKNPKIALVVPVGSFRKTLKNVFKSIAGLSEDMVKGPAEIVNEEYDIVIVEESHRLRKRKNLGRYYGEFDKISSKLGFDKFRNTELDWIQKQGEKSVFFYDELQSVMPSDIETVDFLDLKAQKFTCVLELKNQLRCKGGADYVKFVHNLMNCSFKKAVKKYTAKRYRFLMYESVSDLVNEIKLREEEQGLCRLVAGFSWPWVSKNNEDLHDIIIGPDALKWNSIGIGWVHSLNAIDEVGCIHTTQGYDLNYSAVILGREISYDETKKKIIILENNYYDINGKVGVNDPVKLKKYIINIYTTLFKRGIHGTYIYVCDPALRKYLSQYIHVVKDRRISKPVSKVVTHTRKKASQNAVPFWDIKAAAGGFSPDQLAYGKKIKLPADIKLTSDLFACQVLGESMNEVIPNGAICLFKIDQGGSRDGKIVLVQHTKIQDSDYGNGFTIKSYKSEKTQGPDSWRHKSITLSPKSNDSSYKSIKFNETKEFKLDVIGIFVRVLYTKEISMKL